MKSVKNKYIAVASRATIPMELKALIKFSKRTYHWQSNPILE